MTKTIETHIYRIIQELVNNVVKHSESQLADVKINYDYPLIEVLVKDYGKGFSMNSVSKGIGLSNVDSRIRFMNGKLKKEIDSNGSSFLIRINMNEIAEA